MKTLTDRKLAQQEKVTYDTQRLAEDTRKELQQARALADTQARVVDAERGVQIAEFNAKSAVKTAEGQAQSKTVNATADANVLTTVGNAEAGKTKAIGTAEADVIKLKIASMESGNYAGIEIAKALSASGFKLVPDVMVAGGAAEGGSSLVSVLLANLIRDGLKRPDIAP
jgi:FtsZ-interacting cell division protein ZipA